MKEAQQRSTEKEDIQKGGASMLKQKINEESWWEHTAQLAPALWHTSQLSHRQRDEQLSMSPAWPLDCGSQASALIPD